LLSLSGNQVTLKGVVVLVSEATMPKELSMRKFAKRGAGGGGEANGD
jgi:hypothetical protein